MSESKDYALGYYTEKGKFKHVIEHNSITALWRVKKRIEARRPQVSLEIRKIKH